MCGIAGLYNTRLSKEQLHSCILAMTDSLRHRGPDGGQHHVTENVALGHRRLSIIAPDASANQPMQRGSLTIVYNGELYNYLDEKRRLQSKGIHFQTNSDTEVVLALYESEGISCFKRMNGIFSLAIYDDRTKELVCARDHFGIKPFLYAENGQSIVFASELKGILASTLIEPQIDQNALSLLLETGSVPQPHTMIKGVKSLLPGHVMICSNKGIRTHQYYKMSAGALSLRSDTEYQEAIHESLRKSVKEQLVADVPLGAFLSGGVDSGLIVALMQEVTSSVKTYSVGFENPSTSGQYDETEESAELARYLGTEHHTYTVTDSDAKGELNKIIQSLDHPTIDGVNSYFVSQMASKHVRVALSGTGADEIFGGYSWFENMMEYENAPFFMRLKCHIKGMDYLSYYKSLHGVFTKQNCNALLLNNSTSAKRTLYTHMAQSTGVARTTDLVMASFLQNQLLPDIDTASMSHGLEVRVPYLSVSLVERALSTPDHLKIGKKDLQAPKGTYASQGTKKVLLNIAKGYLPSGFDERPKRGFAMPMQRWINTVWKEEISDTLSTQSIKSRGLFNPLKAEQLISRPDTPWTQKWLLAATEMWCRNILDKANAAS